MNRMFSMKQKKTFVFTVIFNLFNKDYRPYMTVLLKRQTEARSKNSIDFTPNCSQLSKDILQITSIYLPTLIMEGGNC